MSGKTQVCLRAKCLKRRSRERALRRLEPRFVLPSAADDLGGEAGRLFCMLARLVRLGAPVSPARISAGSPLDFLGRRRVAAVCSATERNGSAEALNGGRALTMPSWQHAQRANSAEPQDESTRGYQLARQSAIHGTGTQGDKAAWQRCVSDNRGAAQLWDLQTESLFSSALETATGALDST